MGKWIAQLYFGRATRPQRLRGWRMGQYILYLIVQLFWFLILAAIIAVPLWLPVFVGSLGSE